ncbi:uncharacterized protein BDR25DRAFT_361040 [Lindgomyces ingoldianus]|uniref:Uncharacterized protein n=1 Tax=Lindgomyces ingoldianus TaxID=673940 RepID=A0ACB6QF60_9PLEO|nr:uncharacterized protein BDR25DRAFT_361040 [Lindgomyces ingoldianus]KAF2465130.1 hypothetical protein BDR25DRAFT_361040 [Lindgomyces ingoldianus]
MGSDMMYGMMIDCIDLLILFLLYSCCSAFCFADPKFEKKLWRTFSELRKTGAAATEGRTGDKYRRTRRLRGTQGSCKLIELEVKDTR